MNNFIINEFGVVLNPIEVWYYKPKKSLAWCYWLIKIGICSNGLWDYGYSRATGGSPVSIGKYKTKDEAISEAILNFNEYFKSFNDRGLYKEAFFINAKSSFLEFKNKLLFQSDNESIKKMKSEIETKNNYYQGTLF